MSDLRFRDNMGRVEYERNLALAAIVGGVVGFYSGTIAPFFYEAWAKDYRNISESTQNNVASVLEEIDSGIQK